MIKSLFDLRRDQIRLYELIAELIRILQVLTAHPQI